MKAAALINNPRDGCRRNCQSFWQYEGHFRSFGARNEWAIPEAAVDDWLDASIHPSMWTVLRYQKSTLSCRMLIAPLELSTITKYPRKTQKILKILKESQKIPKDP